MKATGIVRRIDDLGRVVIPKEIRRTLKIRESEPLEIFTDRNGEIILKKYSPIGEFSSGEQQLADAGRGAAGVLIHHQVLNDHDLEAVLLPQLTHGVQVAGVVLAKAHVVTNDHETRVQRIHEGGLHELFGGLRSELQVVVQQQVVVQAQQAHDGAARALTHDVVVGHLGAVHLHRVRVKRDRDRAQTVLFSKGDHARNHAGMSTVHAVKIADGHDRGAVAGGALAQGGVLGPGGA